MGCSTSKLEDEDAVRLCRDRKNFIKQAIEHRNQFGYGHIAYIESLMRVSQALRDYAADDEHHFFLTACRSIPSQPARRLSPEIVMVPKQSFPPQQKQSERSTSFFAVNYMKAGWNPSISVEQWPETPETVRTEYYYPTGHYGVEGYTPAEAPTTDSSFFSSSYARPKYPPASPQASQSDIFWNPFSSLNTDLYAYGNSSEDVLLDEDADRLRKVRQEEGIPDLEEEEDDDDDDEGIQNVQMKEEGSRIHPKPTAKLIASEQTADVSRKNDKVNEIKEYRSQGGQSTEVSETRNAVEHEVNNGPEIVGNGNGNYGTHETPGFTAYVNRRPTSMGEVMENVEAQFVILCDFANELSLILEASRVQPSSSPLESFRMLNPAALLRSASSSRSSSSRFLQVSSGRTNDAYESSNNDIEESCTVSRSHKSTLERLYAWEKKLYEEIKCGERARIDYEKKCMQLRFHDINGEEPFVVDKTRVAIRDLQTRLRVSISSVEYISKRIEALRDQELHPQVMELIQGLARMWRTMAECHRCQKRTVDEAKLLLFSPSTAAVPVGVPLPRASRVAAALEVELRNWTSRLAAWVQAQRCYARALAGWIRRCAPPTLDATAPTPSRSGGGPAPPVYTACVRWSRLMDSVSEAAAIEGLEMFVAGVASMVAGHKREEEEVEDPRRAAVLGPKVVCAGLAVSVGALADLAANSAEGYEELVRTLPSG
ncbi:protein ROLLING AND ERECT LEAF 2-like isoform X1 [Musa acuminata AAA Group]|uniref:protein ROLLING AND ERECT LEAF 2-like isoform X1 n=1 Tax=Musa acuminata AAA Group TaxID=214697 RepID=UPI0031D98F36